MISLNEIVPFHFIWEGIFNHTQKLIIIIQVQLIVFPKLVYYLLEMLVMYRIS